MSSLPPPAEPQETVAPWTSEELTTSARASAAGDDLPSADVPSPNAERARAFCIEHTDIGATTEDVADLVRLLYAVAAEAEARGRAERLRAVVEAARPLADTWGGTVGDKRALRAALAALDEGEAER